MTTLLIVDDHELIRQGLRRAFERELDFTVIGEAASVAEALAQAALHQPDVVVMDVRLPDGSGLDASRELRARLPRVGIVVLTMYAGDEQLFEALDAGASAFVNKDASVEVVIAAARHAATSPTSFTASDLAAAINRRSNPQGPQLTAREHEVLRLLADGHSIPALAKQMFISESTVKTHISKLYEKLGASNRSQALMTAVRLGIVSKGPSA